MNDTHQDFCDMCWCNDIAEALSTYQSEHWKKAWTVCDECAAAALMVLCAHGWNEAEKFMEEMSAEDRYNKPT